MKIACSHLDYVVKRDASLEFSKRSCMLEFADGTSFRIRTEQPSADEPLCQSDYEDLDELWADMPRKIISSWEPPNFPIEVFLPKNLAQLLLQDLT